MSPEETEKLAVLHGRLKSLNRGCGKCTACCTAMAVDMTPVAAMSKPERVKCTHECAGGCAIYEDKPDSCSGFMCLWLAMELSDGRMPARWRPDRVGAVVDINSVGTLTVHLEKENAWEQPGYLRELILYLARAKTPFSQNKYVILDRPGGKHLLFHDTGRTQELVAIGLGPTGLRTYRTKFPGEA